MMRSPAWLLPLLFAGAPLVQAQERELDRIRLDETVISGNQELPKVLYILPWQSAEGRPDLTFDTGLEDQNVLKRIYPPAYRRELQYYQGLQAMEAAASN
jgi:hypothetical protein